MDPDALDRLRPRGRTEAGKIGDDCRRALRGGLPFDDVSAWLVDRCRPRDVLGRPLHLTKGLRSRDAVDPRVRQIEGCAGGLGAARRRTTPDYVPSRIQNPSQWLSDALDRDKPPPVEKEKSRKRSRSRSGSRDQPKRRHAKEKKEEKKKALPEPPSFKNCGPKLKTAFEPLEQTYNLDREELEDDVKQSLLDLKDEKAASCVLALFATLATAAARVADRLAEGRIARGKDGARNRRIKPRSLTTP